jgi:hypothetical protein
MSRTPGRGGVNFVEELEGRTMMSAAPLAAGKKAPPPPPPPGDAYLYEPHAKVEGRTLQQWSAKWWQSVFAAPVFAADGTTFVNPQFVDGDAARATLSKGNVAFLYGAFDGVDHVRGSAAHPVNIPANAPMFMPIQNSEWSNPDTPSKASGYTTLPGDYTAAELAHFADVQTAATIHLSATIDGHVIPEATLFAHRETAPIFGYDLPATNNVPQVFFGEDISGHVSPAAADGYYLMLRPLSPGLHTLVFGGESVDLSATPPQLGASAGRITYVINVLPEKGPKDGKGKGPHGEDAPPPPPAPAAAAPAGNAWSSFGDDDDDDDVLRPAR